MIWFFRRFRGINTILSGQTMHTAIINDPVNIIAASINDINQVQSIPNTLPDLSTLPSIDLESSTIIQLINNIQTQIDKC